MSVWTEDRIARLKTLWPLGWSAQRIADALGDDVTRSAVLGKVHRMKLSEGRPAIAAGPRAPAEPPGGRRLAKRADRPASARAVSSSRGTTPPPSFGTATLLGVRRGECRFPYGDPGAANFRLCGRPIVRGVFCAAHAAIAYRKAPQSAEALIQLAGLT